MVEYPDMKGTKIFIPHIDVITSGGKVTVHAFEEHELVIPSKYLDILKTISKTHNYEGDGAHSFMKEIGDFIESDDFDMKKGIPLEKGVFRICEGKAKKSTESEKTPNLEEILINAAISVREENPERDVVVVVSGSDEKTILDYMLKGKGVKVEKSRFNSLRPEILDQGFVTLDVSEDLIAKMHSSSLTPKDLESIYEHEIRPNQYFQFIAKETSDFGVVKFDEKLGTVIKPFNMKEALGKKIQYEKCVFGSPKKDNYQQAILVDLLLNPEVQFVVAAGGVGTGKTFLSYASALYQRLAEYYTRMILSKPEVSVFQDIGFLPGDEKKKTMPWLASFSTNHEQMPIQIKYKNCGELSDFDQFIEKKVVDAKSLSFIQGASYGNTIYLIDEFQNLSPHQAKAILSRAAEGSKFIVTGDLKQVTNRRFNKGEPILTSKYNGLLSAVHQFSFVEKSPAIGFVKLETAYRNKIANLALEWETR